MDDPKYEVKAIKSYAKACRERVGEFLEKHYTFRDALKTQLREINSALWKLPINALWTIPYISIKKTAESIDKLGWGLPLHWAEHLPMGFHISLQDQIEKKISNEIFLANSGIAHAATVKKELKKYAAGRAVAANFTTSVTVPVVGYMFFEDKSLSLLPLFNKIAVSYAADREAGDFIFGKTLGKSFYSIFTPEASFLDYFIAFIILYFFLTFFSFSVQVLFSPVRKILGLEKKKLHKMIDHIEEELILEAATHESH